MRLVIFNALSKLFLVHGCDELALEPHPTGGLLCVVKLKSNQTWYWAHEFIASLEGKGDLGVDFKPVGQPGDTPVLSLWREEEVVE